MLILAPVSSAIFLAVALFGPEMKGWKSLAISRRSNASLAYRRGQRRRKKRRMGKRWGKISFRKFKMMPIHEK